MATPIYTSINASSALPVGMRLGEFEITGVIGEGGFGIVYSAHDSSLERTVAVKEYLPSAFAYRTESGLVQVKSDDHKKTFNAGLSSFINEAKMLAKFSHPGLVEVFRFWEANGTAYMAMRYYRGVTMREMLRTAPDAVTEQWLCETLDPILLALKELHTEKCYHRDIAPDNIMVLPNGRSVLMDFGAARRIIGGMTQALTTVLKPGFAPIEQYSDDGSLPQGAWTDIYAVGGLLYHAMTGRVPVQAISRMMSDPLKPVADLARQSYSPQLCNAVMKSMAVMPTNRPQSIDELRAALGWVTTLGSTIIRPAPAAAVVDDYPATMIIQTRSASAERFPDIFESNHSEIKPQAAATSGKFDPLSTVGMMKAQGDQVDTARLPTTPAFDPLATVMLSKEEATEVMSVAASAPASSLDPLAALVAPSARAFMSSPEQPEPALQVPSSPAAGVLPGKEFSSTSKANSLALIGLALVALLVVGGSALFYLNSRSDPSAGATPVVATAAPPVLAPAPPQAASSPSTLPTPSEPASTNVATVTAPVPTENIASMAVTAPPLAAGHVANAPDEGTGTVRIELKGGWGTVFVDGQIKGISPPVMVLKLAPGRHQVELRNPALAIVKREVEVSAGKTAVVRHSFSK